MSTPSGGWRGGPGNGLQNQFLYAPTPNRCSLRFAEPAVGSALQTVAVADVFQFRARRYLSNQIMRYLRISGGVVGYALSLVLAVLPVLPDLDTCTQGANDSALAAQILALAVAFLSVPLIAQAGRVAPRLHFLMLVHVLTLASLLAHVAPAFWQTTLLGVNMCGPGYQVADTEQRMYGPIMFASFLMIILAPLFPKMLHHTTTLK